MSIGRYPEEALIRGALDAARDLRVRVDREALLRIIRSSTDLEDCSFRLAQVLRLAVRAQHSDTTDKSWTHEGRDA